MKTVRMLLVSFLVLVISAILVAPANASNRIRPLSDWFVNNGNCPAIYGWMDYDSDNYLLLGTPRHPAWDTYYNDYGKWPSEQMPSNNSYADTVFDGFIAETDLPDGRVAVSVQLHAKNIPFLIFHSSQFYAWRTCIMNQAREIPCTPPPLIVDGRGNCLFTFKFYMPGPKMALPYYGAIPYSDWIHVSLTFNGEDNNSRAHAQQIAKPQTPAGKDEWPIELIKVIPK